MMEQVASNFLRLFGVDFYDAKAFAWKHKIMIGAGIALLVILGAYSPAYQSPSDRLKLHMLENTGQAPAQIALVQAQEQQDQSKQAALNAYAIAYKDYRSKLGYEDPQSRLFWIMNDSTASDYHQKVVGYLGDDADYHNYIVSGHACQTIEPIPIDRFANAGLSEMGKSALYCLSYLGNLPNRDKDQTLSLNLVGLAYRLDADPAGNGLFNKPHENGMGSLAEGLVGVVEQNIDQSVSKSQLFELPPLTMGDNLNPDLLGTSIAPGYRQSILDFLDTPQKEVLVSTVYPNLVAITTSANALVKICLDNAISNCGQPPNTIASAIGARPLGAPLGEAKAEAKHWSEKLSDQTRAELHQKADDAKERVESWVH